MASSHPVLRLLSLVFLLLPHPLRNYLSANLQPKDGGSRRNLRPIVVMPGISCSDIEARLTEAYHPSMPRCGAMKGKGWFGLWENSSELLAHDYVQCFEEQMSLVYDPAINDYRNVPGVETRVPRFGIAKGFHEKNPFHPEWCLTKLIEALEKVGYRDGDSMFGAPYDIRYAPPIPGQSSLVYSSYYSQAKALVEAASMKHNNKKVILFGHSFGGMVALEFVRNMPPSWRKKYVKRLILVAPTLSTGFVATLKNIASGPDNLMYVPTATALSLRPMWRSFETNIVDLPSPSVFGKDPIVITRQRNYSAHELEDFFTAIGFEDGVAPFRRRTLPKMNYFEAPMVPVTCINGVGNRTPRQLLYWDDDFDVLPRIIYGDGDGDINLASMLAFDKEMRRKQGQKRRYKSIKLMNAQHGSIVTDEWALKRVIQEILAAN